MGEISSYSPWNVGQQGLKEGSGLGPKVSSWNQCCCVQTANLSPCRAATEHFAPSKSAHKQPCNGAELQDSFHFLDSAMLLPEYTVLLLRKCMHIVLSGIVFTYCFE